jgi:ParB family transcriptional regulator, chromosome partitioning protein
MGAIEEHKPAEKRRALGRGLDSLLPSGPRMVAAAPATALVPSPAVMPPPVVIPTGAAAPLPSVVPEAIPTSGFSSPVPGEIAELHAGVDHRKSPPKQSLDGVPAAASTRLDTASDDLVQQISLDLIDENPYQTRTTFDSSALHELAESIKANGLAQPIVVRPGANGRYVLVLGERRCRASKLAGKRAVSAIVRQLGNEQAAEMTIVENLQRQDLNCLEQAQAFARLSRDFNLTQEQIGQRTGVSRESVANYMRLLKLPKSVLALIGEGQLGFSEARVLLEALPHLSPDTIANLASTAVQLGLTVRDLKTRVDYHVNPELHKPEPRPEKPVDPNVRDAERRLREALGMRVRVMAYQGNKGQVVIRYESLADFDRILERLSRDI